MNELLSCCSDSARDGRYGMSRGRTQRDQVLLPLPRTLRTAAEGLDN